MLFETSGTKGAAVSGRAALPDKQPLQRKTANAHTPQPTRKPAVAPAAKAHVQTVTGWPSQQKGQKTAGYKANSLIKPVAASVPFSPGIAFKKANPVAAPVGAKGQLNAANHKAAFRHQPPAFGSSPVRKPMPGRSFRSDSYPANAVRYNNTGQSAIPGVRPVLKPGNIPVTTSKPFSFGTAFKKANPVAAPAGVKSRFNAANHKGAFRYRPPFAFGSSPARKPIPGRFFRPGNYPANAVGYNNAGQSPVPGAPPALPPGNTPEKAYPVSPASPSCQQCGSAGAGCSVLSGFATGSDRLTPFHYQQLAAVAHTILQQNLTVVRTTGHTDAIGSDENNIVLGRMRSRNATNALRKALNEIKPGAQDGIFWRIDTKGEAEPVSDTDPALNRRVEVCLQQQFY